MTLGALQYKSAPLILDSKPIYIGEDVSRPQTIKIAKETAIWEGDYWIDITYSNRFKRMMPLIYNDRATLRCVSGDKFFDGIRQHPGINEASTEGCQLTGLGRSEWGVSDSHAAFDLYFKFLSDLITQNAGAIPYKIINKQSN